MSTPPNLSNFISEFSGSTPIDIISNVSGAYSVTNTTAHTYNARYFYLGNLLIQFNDFATGGITPDLDTGNYTINFPVSYNAALPYTVIVSPASTDNGNVTATLKSISNSYFSVAVGSSRGTFSFLAIGPRPSNTYT